MNIKNIEIINVIQEAILQDTPRNMPTIHKNHMADMMITQKLRKIITMKKRGTLEKDMITQKKKSTPTGKIQIILAEIRKNNMKIFIITKKIVHMKNRIETLKNILTKKSHMMKSTKDTKMRKITRKNLLGIIKFLEGCQGVIQTDQKQFQGKV